jgi:hypothetical protein
MNGPLGAHRAGVNCMRKQLLARAGFAQEQHGCAALRRAARLRA